MGELFITPLHLIILLIVLAVFLIPVIFFILTMQKTLQKCAPESRTIDPALCWLYLIPVVSLVFGFFMVIGIANTLRREFNRRGIAVFDPTQVRQSG